MTKEPFVLCGELVLRYQDIGCADAFEVDGKDFIKSIRDHFDIDGYDPYPYAPIGRVRITIEPLSATSDREMNEEELRGRINQRLQVAEKALANTTYQEFIQREVPVMKLRNALTLLKRGNIDGAWALLETSE